MLSLWLTQQSSLGNSLTPRWLVQWVQVFDLIELLISNRILVTGLRFAARSKLTFLKKLKQFLLAF